jgi:hypothetical protein
MVPLLVEGVAGVGNPPAENAQEDVIKGLLDLRQIFEGQ